MTNRRYALAITEQERQFLMKLLVEGNNDLPPDEMRLKCNLLRAVGTADLKSNGETR